MAKIYIKTSGVKLLPASLYNARITLVGGGAGGAGGADNAGDWGAGGGGAAGEQLRFQLEFDDKPSISAHIGAGGSGGSNADGSNGGDTWCDERGDIVAKGGERGYRSGPPEYARGGYAGFSTPMEGVEEFYGGDGGSGNSSAQLNAGGGGGGIFRGDFFAMYAGFAFGNTPGHGGGVPGAEGSGGIGAIAAGAGAAPGVVPGGAGGGGSYQLQPEVATPIDFNVSFTPVFNADIAHWSFFGDVIASLVPPGNYGPHNRLLILRVHGHPHSGSGGSAVDAGYEVRCSQHPPADMAFDMDSTGTLERLVPATTHTWRVWVHFETLGPTLPTSFQMSFDYWLEDQWGTVSSHGIVTMTMTH